MKLSSILMFAASLAGGAPAAVNAACVDGQATGGKVYVGVQAGNPLGSLPLKCALQSASTSFTGPVLFEDGTFPITTALAAQAWADNAGLHAWTSSAPTPNAHTGVDPLGAYPGYALAQAGSALTFGVVAPVGAQPNTRTPVSFEVSGNGTMRGTPGFFAGRSAYEVSFSSNGSNFTNSGYYRDSLGTDEPDNYLYNFATGDLRAVEFGINFTGRFLPGLNGFNLRLDLISIGDAAADFRNTVALTGLRVAPGYSLTLPDGLYSLDPGDPNHYVLTALLPVPEPTQAALLTPALLGLLAWRAWQARQAR